MVWGPGLSSVTGQSFLSSRTPRAWLTMALGCPRARPVAAEDSPWSGALPTPLSQQAFGCLGFPAAPSQSNSLLQLFREEMLHD